MKTLLISLTMAACLFGTAAFGGPVNINTANAKTLATELDGVGDKSAAAIVKERANGPYKSAEDMAKRVEGVGKKIIEKNKSNILIK